MSIANPTFHDLFLRLNIALLCLRVPVLSIASAQELQFERLSVDQGLSQNSVNCFLQDRQGFVWIGTNDGLNRFDGYEFLHYRHLPGDSTSISNNTITAMCAGRDGTLWIGTNGGLNQFDRDTETFRHLRHDADNHQSLDDNRVRAIFEDHAGTLWVGTFTGLNKFDREQGKFKRYRHKTEESGNFNPAEVYALAERPQSDELFVGTWGAGLFRFHRTTETFTRCFVDHIDPRQQTRSWIRTLHFAGAGELWVTGDNGIYKYDLQHETLRRVYEVAPGLAAFTQAMPLEKSGRWLVGTEGSGLLLFDRDWQNARFLRHEPEDPGSLSDDWVQTLFEDRGGEIWLGTRSGGISKLDPLKKKFLTYQHEAQNKTSLSGNYVTAIITTASGAIWVATRFNGISVFEPVSRTFAHIRHDPRHPNGLNTNEIFSLLQDRVGRIWIGTWGGGLNCFDPQSGQFIHYTSEPGNPYSLLYNFVGSICETRQGELWVGTPMGVAMIRLDELPARRFKRYVYSAGDGVGLSHYRADVIFEDLAGQIWIGTDDGGLNRLDRQTDSFIHFKHDPYNANSLSSNKVLTIFQDSRETFWIGTWGGGLDRFDRATERFIHYTEADGLPNAEINGIAEDGRGNLWISTNKGLSQFDPSTKSFKSYDRLDGLPGHAFSPRALLRNAASGEFFLGGPDGLTVFHPDSLQDNLYIPPVVIASLRRFKRGHGRSEAILEKGIASRKEMTLSYRDNILTFEFAALNYRNAARNQYDYKLEGFNDDWIHLGTKRDATFTNLAPGEYVLRVKGSNNDGIWNEGAASLKITITPPWWKTWWAYSLFSLAALALLYGLRRYEMNRVSLRNRLRLEQVEAEKLKELDQVKSRFFANISHEFRTPLTLVLGQIDTAISGMSEKKFREKLLIARRNAQRLLHLVSQLLDLSKLESGGMKLNLVRNNVIPFLKNLAFSFESLAEEKSIALKFSCDKPEIVLDYEPDKLEKIITNLLSNAFKFTPNGGSIVVTVTTKEKTARKDAETQRIRKKIPLRDLSDFAALRENDFAIITVADSGIGIPADRLPHIFDRFYQVDSADTRKYEGTGIGLALAKELVELHSGSISVTSAVGKGTEFVVLLPVFSNQLSVISDQASGKWQVASEQEIISPTLQHSIDPSIQPSIDPAIQDRELVLIVEDNADVRDYIRDNLEGAYRVQEAADGEQGLLAAQKAIPDLIISDAMMPKMDGYEFSKRIRADEMTSHIPIIMLTAKAGDDDKITGLQTGVDAYLIKPFNAKELLVRIENLIAMRRKLRERFSTATVIRPAEVSAVSVDQEFMQRVLKAVENLMREESFDVETLATAMHMSKAQLNRKLQALIGQPPGQLIRSMRLQRAADLLQQGAGNVAEICYQVGFSDQANFTHSFKKQFGVTPGEFRREVEHQRTNETQETS